MRGGRSKLPVVAEIGGLAPGEARVWSLRRADFEAMEKLLSLLSEHRVVITIGAERLTGAIALAAAASAAGRSTALVECDLSRPRLAAELGLEAGPGLHEYLRWEARAAQILQPLALAGPAARRASAPLVCISGGAPADESATLLRSESFRHAVAKLRNAYDLAVLVAPSRGSEGSAFETVAASADALLACVAPRQASGREARELRAAARRLPAELVGAVVVAAPAA
jgi:receptor protein-tyrosine kinase